MPAIKFSFGIMTLPHYVFSTIKLKSLSCSLPQIKTFFKLKQKHSDLYEDLYPNSVIHVYEQELVRLVPTRDQRNGQRILVIHCGSKYISNRAVWPLFYPKQTIIYIFRFIWIHLQKNGRQTNAHWLTCSVQFKWPLPHRCLSQPHKFAAVLLYWTLKGCRWVTSCNLHHHLLHLYSPGFRYVIPSRDALIWAPIICHVA